MVPGMTLMLNTGRLSDLFFNYDHPRRDALYKVPKPEKNGPTWEQERAAVLEDAREFLEAIDVPVSYAEDFADDFMRRR